MSDKPRLAVIHHVPHGAQRERFAIYKEELGENVQLLGKQDRFGIESYSPFDPNQVTNKQLLEKEVGDVLIAIGMLVKAGDIDPQAVANHMKNKVHKLKDFIVFDENLDYIPNFDNEPPLIGS